MHLVTITARTSAATDLGYLLHKNPASVFTEETWFGRVSVFYPRATQEECTAAMLVEVDPIGLVRRRDGPATLSQYVNDRPYVASSLTSVALSAALSTGMNGRSKERPQRVNERMALSARISAVTCGGGDALIHRLFEPLGYTVQTERQPLDAAFPDWGLSQVYSVQVDGQQTVQDLLSHLYVLLPVLDNAKHYYVGADEMEKLLAKGERWLAAHPEREMITQRYLRYRRTIVREAMQRLQDLQEDAVESLDATDERAEAQEQAVEAPMRLNDLRLAAALEAVAGMQPAPRRVLDLGCGEGRLLERLLKETSIPELIGVDVAPRTLERAAVSLRLERLPERVRARVRLLQGSAVYRDDRFLGCDAMVLMEVIEHLDAARLPALEAGILGYARPRRLIVTTPNREFNALWPSLPADKLRHRDHRFEWTRAEFARWCERMTAAYGYTVSIYGIGPSDPDAGSPTQMAVFDAVRPE